MHSLLLSNTEYDKHNVYMVLAIFRTCFRKPSLQINENKGKEASSFHSTIWYKKPTLKATAKLRAKKHQ